jgi:5-methylcytosine-specific restriction protein A
VDSPKIRRPDRRSAQAEAYRRFYRTARWQRTRADQLAKQPLCETCQSQGRIAAATVCNHADKDSKATEEGFFAGPFTSECQPCHDSVIQKQEKRGHIIGADASGRPLDPGHHWNRT